MRTRLFLGLLLLGLLGATPAEAQLRNFHARVPVRMLYAVPTDREFRSDYRQSIQNAFVDFQSWLRRELEGRTFSLSGITPEECRLSENADFYGRGDAWNKVLSGVQHCAPVRGGTSDFGWVIFADVEESCDEPHELGRGGLGLSIMASLDGLAYPKPYYYCDEGPYEGSLGKAIGGVGHELGHVFGLPHPPGCDEGLPTCDRGALMWDGYMSYPNTYLRDDEKAILLASPFIDRAGEDEAPQARAPLMALYDATNGNNWTNSTNWGTDEPFGHWYGVRTDGGGRVSTLDLDNNNLTGPIPSELTSLTNLEFLHLNNNNLTGSIPPELGTLINLKELDLDNNNLTGPIPPELTSLTNLEFLNLYGNNLTGSIPPELGTLINLKVLWVAHNNLTGSIPPELGTLINLEGLWAADNNLTGPLPSSMTNLGPLEYLHIENNAGLCAPADAAFQAWLARVLDFGGEICADEPTPTMLTLSAAPAPTEGGEPVTVTATLDNPAPANGMTVTLTTSGTATLDTDYTLSSTTITLAEGETAGTVTITVTDDAEDDAGETIVIDAESTNQALTAEQLTLTIEDNDGPAPVPALPLGGAMLLGLLLTLLGAVRVRMRDRTDIAQSY